MSKRLRLRRDDRAAPPRSRWRFALPVLIVMICRPVSARPRSIERMPASSRRWAKAPRLRNTVPQVVRPAERAPPTAAQVKTKIIRASRHRARNLHRGRPGGASAPATYYDLTVTYYAADDFLFFPARRSTLSRSKRVWIDRHADLSVADSPLGEEGGDRFLDLGRRSAARQTWPFSSSIRSRISSWPLGATAAGSGEAPPRAWPTAPRRSRRALASCARVRRDD